MNKVEFCLKVILLLRPWTYVLSSSFRFHLYFSCGHVLCSCTLIQTCKEILKSVGLTSLGTQRQNTFLVGIFLFLFFMLSSLNWQEGY